MTPALPLSSLPLTSRTASLLPSTSPFCQRCQPLLERVSPDDNEDGDGDDNDDSGDDVNDVDDLVSDDGDEYQNTAKMVIMMDDG